MGFEILNHCASNPVRSRPRATRHTNGPNVKNPPKMWLKKFVKFTDHTCACHDLTNFEFEGNTIAGNGSYVNLQKLAEKNLWNHRTYFWRVLAFCNHCETLHSEIIHPWTRKTSRYYYYYLLHDEKKNPSNNTIFPHL